MSQNRIPHDTKEVLLLTLHSNDLDSMKKFFSGRWQQCRQQSFTMLYYWNSCYLHQTFLNDLRHWASWWSYNVVTWLKQDFVQSTHSEINMIERLRVLVHQCAKGLHPFHHIQLLEPLSIALLDASRIWLLFSTKTLASRMVFRTQSERLCLVKDEGVTRKEFSEFTRWKNSIWDCMEALAFCGVSPEFINQSRNAHHVVER